MRTVTIVLLGDPGCGKSTLLSYGRLLAHQRHLLTSSSRLSQGQSGTHATGRLPTLRDLDQPFVFNVSMYNRGYRLEFSDTASTDNYAVLRPDFVILCYDITNRASLINVQQVWRKDVTRLYKRDGEDPPVMLMGLKRDARVEAPGVIYPEEVCLSRPAWIGLLLLIWFFAGLQDCARDAV